MIPLPPSVVTFLAKPFVKPAAIGSVFVLLIALLSLGKCVYDRHVVNSYVAGVQQKAAPATEKAADQRVKDDRANFQNEKELHDAINAAPGGTLSPAAHALACQRLHKAGRHPASCGSDGPNGKEADPR